VHLGGVKSFWHVQTPELLQLVPLAPDPQPQAV